MLTGFSDIELGFALAPLGLAVTRERVIQACNRRFCELFDCTEVQALQRPMSDFYPSDHEFAEIGRIGLAQMAQTGRYDDQRIMRKCDGTLFWCAVQGQSLNRAAPFETSVWSFTDLSHKRPTRPMTVRQREVAMLLVRGKATKEIATALGISPRTVEIHRSNLLKCFGVRNSGELLAALAGHEVRPDA